MRNHFFVIAFLVLVAVCSLAFLAGFPVAPFFVITLVAETLFGLHLHDDRGIRFLKALGHAVKTDHSARMRHVH